MILIFGGTTEGRIAVRVADTSGRSFFYSTKSDRQAQACRSFFGRAVLAGSKHLKVVQYAHFYVKFIKNMFTLIKLKQKFSILKIWQV